MSKYLILICLITSISRADLYEKGKALESFRPSKSYVFELPPLTHADQPIDILNRYLSIHGTDIINAAEKENPSASKVVRVFTNNKIAIDTPTLKQSMRYDAPSGIIIYEQEYLAIKSELRNNIFIGIQRYRVFIDIDKSINSIIGIELLETGKESKKIIFLERSW